MWRNWKTKLEQSDFFLKFWHWEYWPMYVANIPVVLFWWWFALKARQLFFFSAVNPAIETGGVLGESKINILDRIPVAYKPRTVFLAAESRLEIALEKMQQAGLSFPIVAKPNVGERGLLVTILQDADALGRFLEKRLPDLVLQSYVDLPEEVSVLYHRLPGTDHGRVTSICLKEKLSVTGDGQQTIRALMQAKPRARLQLARFEREQPVLLSKVPETGEQVWLEPIGNHSRGTMFLSGNHLINEAVHQTFHQIGREMEGIFYGRFDLKCKSLSSLETGEGIQILEFNGVAGEPAHIYDPAIPIFQKYRDYFRHWKIIYQIYQLQRSRGVEAMSLQEARASWLRYRAYMRRLQVH